MNETAKITLSDDEQQLVCNTGWILTKRIIIEKVYSLFGNVSEMMKALVEEIDDKELQRVCSISPKISRGENYLLLPYVILDFPRCFEKDDMLAIRSLFWWGNHFSVHLLVSGIYKERIAHSLIISYSMLAGENYYVCISTTPWDHHFEPDNYKEINSLSVEAFSELIVGSPFVKIGRKIGLDRWGDVELFLVETFDTLKCLVVK